MKDEGEIAKRARELEEEYKKYKKDFNGSGKPLDYPDWLEWRKNRIIYDPDADHNA